MAEAHTLRYIPPFSSFLTPVESAFSAWKAEVRSKLSDPSVQLSLFSPPTAQTLTTWRQQRLTQIGEEAMPVITRDKCADWQRQCMSFFPKCIDQQDIVV